MYFLQPRIRRIDALILIGCAILFYLILYLFSSSNLVDTVLYALPMLIRAWHGRYRSFALRPIGLDDRSRRLTRARYRQDEQMTGAARDLLLLIALIDIDATWSLSRKLIDINVTHLTVLMKKTGVGFH